MGTVALMAETTLLHCSAPVQDGHKNYCAHYAQLSLPSAESPATVPVHRLRDLERMVNK